jgi:hypothetical protein
MSGGSCIDRRRLSGFRNQSLKTRVAVERRQIAVGCHSRSGAKTGIHGLREIGERLVAVSGTGRGAPETAPVITEIFERFSEGRHSVKALVKE